MTTIRFLGSVAFAAVLSSTTYASDLDLRIESGGSTSITVRPGEVISYDVIGELTDNLNQGLALVLLDLSFDGGDLSQANSPVGVRAVLRICVSIAFSVA